MQITRRGLITGLAAFVAAPAIVRASSLMAVKPIAPIVPALDPNHYLTDDLAFDPMQYRREFIEEFERSFHVLRREANGLIPRGTITLRTVD
jgi:hypothetical protein